MCRRIYLWLAAFVALGIIVSPAMGSSTNERAATEFARLMEAYGSADGTQRLEFEEDAMEIRDILSRDRERLCYSKTERRAVSRGGSYPKYKTFEVTKCIRYCPNEIIAEIRSMAPPKPIMMVWKEKDNRRQKVVCEIRNLGKTRMEDVKILLSGPRRHSKRLGTLMPGAVLRETFFFDSGHGKIEIRMEEKYQYITVPVTLF